MKKDSLRLAWLIILFTVSCTSYAKTNFITIKLPESVNISLPRNWVLISNNQRITLDTWVESTFDLKDIPNGDSRLPFAANYYASGLTTGIINARFYPTIEMTQDDARSITEADVRDLDKVIRASMIRTMNNTGLQITSWEGTTRSTINGIMVFVTEYHRKSLRGSGIFRVRLVRVLAGSRSFTLTVSYLESQSYLLKNITDRIISSLTMSGYQ